MINSLKILATSKRVWLALITLAAEVLVLRGYVVPPELIPEAAAIVAGVMATLIAGQSVTDVAAGLSSPTGYDHKGRRIVPISAVLEIITAAIAEDIIEDAASAESAPESDAGEETPAPPAA